MIHAALIALHLTDLIPLHRGLGVNYALALKGEQIDTIGLRRQTADASERLASLMRNPETQVTAERCGPLTWQEGKVEGFRLFHSEEAKPFLVAGDSPNDFAMQFLTPHDSGLRVRIAKDPAHEAKRLASLQKSALSAGWEHSVAEDLKGWIDIDPQPYGVLNNNCFLSKQDL